MHHLKFTSHGKQMDHLKLAIHRKQIYIAVALSHGLAYYTSIMLYRFSALGQCQRNVSFMSVDFKIHTPSK